MNSTTQTATGRPTVVAAQAMLAQLRTFLAELQGESYITPSPRLMGSTIGQHVRHTLDHFSAALTSLDGGVIDYDHRERQTPIESDVAAALDAIDMLQRDLDRLPPAALDNSVTIRVMLSAEGDQTDLKSTLARELAFAAHHGVHHAAMMASIAGELGASVPAGFGKAPSTRNYEQSTAAQQA